MKVCGIYHLHDLYNLRLGIRNQINKLSYKHVYYLQNRYKANDLEYEVRLKDKITRLQAYEGVLDRLRKRVLSGCDPCLNRPELQELVEKITRIIGKNCIPELSDVCVDRSREDEWIMMYPFCRSYEEWEKWAKRLCEKLNLEISASTDKVTKFILEISRETITPNVLLAISAYTEVREDLNLKLTRSTEEVKLDFKLLVEKVPSVDLTLEVYREMVEDHKLSFDIIKTVYEEGLNLQLTKGEVELKTPVDVYNLSEISGKIDPSYLKKFGMKPSIDKNDLLQDYK